MRLSRAVRRLALLALIASTTALGACLGDSVTVPGATPLESQAWAPALEVTLSEFAKLTSGVYYRDSLVGTGALLSGQPTVSVYYAGYIPSGTKFDEVSSQGGGTPVCFPLASLIPGWDFGMQGMKVGGKRRLLIPASLGYGARSVGAIPANSNLLFNIELVGTGCTP